MKLITISSLLVVVLAVIVSNISAQELTCSRPSQMSVKTLRSPKYLKIKEKVVKNIPCDLYNQNYCNIPGELYPWHSVRRFVYENQGLIRRMYGEVRQLSVLRMEIDHHDDPPQMDLNTNSIDDSAESSSSRQFDNDDRIPQQLVTIANRVATPAPLEKLIEKSISELIENSSSKAIEPEESIVTESTITTKFPENSDNISDNNSEMTTTGNPINDDDQIMTTDKDHIIYYADAAKRNGNNNNNNNSNNSSMESQTQSDDLNLNSSIGQENTEIIQRDDVKPVLKAVNACPVKEEVVAPYWANSTRGEILALLNLYPFEQYIHWEKCNQEHKQMFCRNGCRCEQQYRLHRLLAFDPTNECRGIFSDWFRFPSCCVCKCYLTEEEIASHYRRSDLPQSNPQNNRSPRKLAEQDEFDFFQDEDEFYEDEDQPDVGGVDSLHNHLINENHFFYNQQQPR